jgi:UDP-N-acetylmuramoyl-tripeptide--D-alanyl-D-alanine ligase
LLGWLQIFFKAWKLILIYDKSYPEILILEFGIDHPGDMNYLMSIVKPKIGIVTAVSYSHLEYFGSVHNIRKEKQVLVENLLPNGVAVLNFDSRLVRDMLPDTRSKVLSYGLEEGVDLRAQDISYNFDKGDYELAGINFKLNYRGSIVPVMMKNVISPSAIYAALAAAASGIYFGLNLVEIAQKLADFSLPLGRMNVLAGINHSFIIDDTYNSSPESCLSALGVLGRIKLNETSKKYAVLGDMLEIGDYTEEGHKSVGFKFASSGADYLIVVGPKAKGIAEGAILKGIKEENIFYFPDSSAAGDFLVKRLAPGDIVLAKASQGIRMEKAVKKIIAESDKAGELLVRQDESWEA